MVTLDASMQSKDSIIGWMVISRAQLPSVDDCAAAQPAVICHGAGNASAQLEAFTRWVRAAESTLTGWTPGDTTVMNFDEFLQLKDYAIDES